MFLVVYPIRVGSVRVQISSGLIRFGSFRVRVYIGSIRVRVSSESIRAISNFGSLQFRVGSILGRFDFGFQVEIGSTLSHVGSGPVLGRSVWVIQFGSLLLGLDKPKEIMNLWNLKYHALEDRLRSYIDLLRR